MNIITVKEMLQKSEKIGYNQALNDLMLECRLKRADGFIMSDMVLTDIIEMLIEKNNGK